MVSRAENLNGSEVKKSLTANKDVVILGKIASGQALTTRWMDALPVDLREIALRVMQFSTAPGERKARLYAELAASERAELAQEVERADPGVDPDSLAGPGYEFMTLGDALLPQPKLQWAIRGLFSRPSVNIIFGSPKALKSMLATDSAIAVAAGQRWLTAPDGSGGFAVEPSPVAWVDLENGKRRMAERVSAFGRGRELTGGTPFFGWQARILGRILVTLLELGCWPMRCAIWVLGLFGSITWRKF